MQQLEQRSQEIDRQINSLQQRKNELQNFITQKTFEKQKLKGKFSELENFKQNNQDSEDEKIKDLLIHCDNRQKEYNEQFEQCKQEITQAQQELNQIDIKLVELEGNKEEIQELKDLFE